MLIKLSFKGLVDVLGYSALLKSILILVEMGVQHLMISARRVGALIIDTGNHLKPHFLKNKENYRKSEYTIAKGIKKYFIQYMLGFTKVNTICFCIRE